MSLNFNQIPRVQMSHTPTPLEFVPRLSEHLGRKIYIKRDDCTGLAGGGNKTRKLEYLIADARTKGADTLITIGGLQSNHARQTAAAAAKFGFDCELILQDVEGVSLSDYATNGNFLLDKLFGCNIHRLSFEQDCEEYAKQLIAQLETENKVPYLVPIGGSNVVGSLGYVRCAKEIIQQISAQSYPINQIVLATGSAGTQAGLLAGLIEAGCDIPVLGITVSRSAQEQNLLVNNLLEDILVRLELDKSLAKGRVQTNSDYYGDGYGIATAPMISAVKHCAQLEGLLFDPVYTGKAMAGLFDLCNRDYFTLNDHILFLHSGGSQGLFAYAEVF